MQFWFIMLPTIVLVITSTAIIADYLGTKIERLSKRVKKLEEKE